MQLLSFSFQRQKNRCCSTLSTEIKWGLFSLILFSSKMILHTNEKTACCLTVGNECISSSTKQCVVRVRLRLGSCSSMPTSFLFLASSHRQSTSTIFCNQQMSGQFLTRSLTAVNLTVLESDLMES